MEGNLLIEEYKDEIKMAKGFFERMEYREAGKKCSEIFDSFIRFVYSESKKNAHEEKLKKITLTEEKHSIKIKKKLDRFTMGEFIILIQDRDIDIFNLIDKNLIITKKINLIHLVDIRNRIVHNDIEKPVSPLEAKYLYYSLLIILEEMGCINDSKTCPSCEKNISNNHIFCPYCETQLKIIYPECTEEVTDDFKVCPKCGNSLSNPEKRETEFLKHVLAAILIASKEDKECPICGTNKGYIDTQFDDELEDNVDYFDHTCECKNEIFMLLKTGNIDVPIANKFIAYYQKIGKLNLWYSYCMRQ